MIAVDPGVSGAMAYDVGNGPTVVPWGDVAQMHHELAQVLQVLLLEKNPPTAYMEDVSASPIMSKKGAFTFGHNFGQWETLFYCFNVRLELIKPQTWQKGIKGISGTTGPARKRALKAHAARLFPQFRVTEKTQDALLILNYVKSK